MNLLFLFFIDLEFNLTGFLDLNFLLLSSCNKEVFYLVAVFEEGAKALGVLPGHFCANLRCLRICNIDIVNYLVKMIL